LRILCGQKLTKDINYEYTDLKNPYYIQLKNIKGSKLHINHNKRNNMELSLKASQTICGFNYNVVTINLFLF